MRLLRWYFLTYLLYNSCTNSKTPFKVISIRILCLNHCISNFYLWCLSHSKSYTKTRSPTQDLIYYACVFFSYLVWFFNINRTVKVCYFSLLSTIHSIIKPSAPSFNTFISLNIAFCIGVLLSVNFHLGIYLSMISKRVKLYRQTSQQFIKEMILGILHP